MDGSTTGTLVITPEPPDQDDVRHLLRAADDHAAALYPLESRHGLDTPALMVNGARFFVARQDGQAIGCAGYLVRGDGSAEVKSVFVDPTWRGRGIAGRLLEAIEAAARSDGIRLLQLETGARSPDALALYRRLGYRDRGPFGTYGPDPLSVFLEKIIEAP
jgi:putative acetyltransferase